MVWWSGTRSLNFVVHCRVIISFQIFEQSKNDEIASLYRLNYGYHEAIMETQNPAAPAYNPPRASIFTIRRIGLAFSVFLAVTLFIEFYLYPVVIAPAINSAASGGKQKEVEATTVASLIPATTIVIGKSHA